jgi:O-succinylbenzoate synthase
MRIERIELYHISQMLVSPFETSFGRQEVRQCLLLAMSGDGLTGWGECPANSSPGYSYETSGTAWHILSDFLIPDVLGNELQESDELLGWLTHVRGHPMAKATLDQAAWDLIAQREGRSFADKLAQPYPEGARDRVKVGVSIGIQQDIDETLGVIERHLEQGYQRIKLKIKPGRDLETARAARSAFPDTSIMLDANSAYALTDAALFQAMDDLDLLMIEQPLGYDDIYDHSQLRPLIEAPLCLDESIHSADHTRFALAIEACDIINIKPARVGGWTERAGQLALASLPGFTLPGDISATERYYTEDVARPDFVLNEEDSTISVPDKPGLGVEIDYKRLAKNTLRHKSFKH